ncbi:MAG: DUF2784 domain-containing protein [Polycyclovorans sp.]|nr:DUF2784 domain-containing protein [Polycyclovorans sp.]
MTARLAADLVLVIHLAFIVWAVFGGLAVLWRGGMLWAHLPALAWGVWIELTHGICPLTPLENHFRAVAGQSGYDGGFIEHYLWPLIYPAGLTPAHQLGLASALLLINGLIYGVVGWRWRWRRRQRRYD